MASGLTPYGGSADWCLGRGPADYVLDFVADHPEVSRCFRITFMPDEVFYQTSRVLDLIDAELLYPPVGGQTLPEGS